ncbi:TadE/TadG family type IV pilus assembly protein [Mameliella sediminis]|uniref:TadE/TadG family type IV pilus assembly protein n=1 Tax=Mameliella sediminis TaxID=2836866 RepID=UPI001C4820DE|nr:hypothetical protein [Mameliella sediminis]MBY6117047.1 hypothetical protein [Antarctobacter heliothermus]MBY6146799.1 hypothetical protein [Mameliella alba]MBV7396318.1 hypothetical protein [Mameliella sediminis]MBY6160729.1 hypothetical protein [Mameliella alba]MBY6169199.1 hypothetical protein [Mameliella alba]
MIRSKILLRHLRGFAQDTRGNMALEALIWLPFVLFLLAATFSLHDAFRYKALNTKAAYTISDAISRETDPIDASYLDGMIELLDFLVRPGADSSLRVTLVRYNGTTDSYEAEWSQTRGSLSALQTAEVSDMYNQLPTMLHNERVIVVETETYYAPPFAIPGLTGAGLFYNFGFTRPRFAPKIVWSDG